MHPEFLSNTYLVAEGPGAEVLFVDAGGPLEPLAQAVADHGLRPTAVLLTHHHHDHVAELPAILERAEAPADSVTDDDVSQLRASADTIVAATEAMLDQVRRGELAKPSEVDETGLARTGWL